jgi:hypothetical protein
VRRIVARRADGAETESVERAADGENGWQAAGGSPAKTVAADALDAWLKLLAGLPASRVERLGAGAHDGEAFGLSAPWLEITLDLTASNAVRKTLLVGAVTPDGGRYAMVRGHDAVFALAPETLLVLESRLTQAPCETPPPAPRTMN